MKGHGMVEEDMEVDRKGDMRRDPAVDAPSRSNASRVIACHDKPFLSICWIPIREQRLYDFLVTAPEWASFSLTSSHFSLNFWRFPTNSFHIPEI